MAFDRDGVVVKLVLFDLDGTLVDTAPDIAKAVNMMLLSLGLREHAQEQITNWIGNGIPRLIKRALTGELNGEPDAELFRRASESFGENYLHIVHQSVCDAYPDVVETLETLWQGNVPMVCITNKAEAFTIPLLKNLGFAKYFSLVLSGDSLPKQKPDPLPLLHACEHFNVDPKHAVFVGDSCNDVKAAKAAAMRVICVPYGYNHGNPIQDAGPDLVIQTLRELPPLLHV
jgi:phosphoglycolate phosphatase